MRGTAFLLTMLALFARVAHAAPAVEAHVAAAERALGAGDIALAAVEHEQAFELDHQPGHLADAARVLAGEPARCEAAGATLARYFAACGADCAAGVKVQAEAEPRCSGALTVETVPAGAATDAPPRLWAGAHRVIATWPDGERRGAVVCVAPGQPATLRIDRGQPTAVPLTGAARGRAFAHQEAAFSHAAAGQGCAAAAEFAAAYAVVPEQGFLFNLGVAHALRPETCGAAVEAFDRFLAACGDCAQAADARVRRAEAASGCTGKLVVQVEPTGAEVRVNGAPMAAETQVLPGIYTVQASAPAHLPAETKAPVAIGQVRTVRLVLKPTLPATPPPVEPAVQVEAPPAEPGVAPHWKWVALAGAGAAAVGGGVFTWLAQGAADDFESDEAQAMADQQRSHRDALQGDLDRFERNRALAYTGFGLAGAGLIAAAVLFVVEDAPPEATAHAATPAFSWRF